DGILHPRVQQGQAHAVDFRRSSEPFDSNLGGTTAFVERELRRRRGAADFAGRTARIAPEDGTTGAQAVFAARGRRLSSAVLVRVRDGSLHSSSPDRS